VAAVYRYWSALVVLLVIVQIGLAGYGAFGVAHDVDDAGSVDEDGLEDLFGPHAGVGYLVVLSFLILLILAFAARSGRQRVIWSASLFGLGILQIILAWIGFGVPALGALHPINAMVIAGVAFSIAYRNFRGGWRADGPLERAAGGV
jgi:uncharacterized protein DUF6220